MKRMRGMALMALVVLCGTACAQDVVRQGTAKDDLFAGTEMFAKNAESATEIDMGPKTLDMVNGKDKGKAHRTVLSVVRTYTYAKPGMYNMADVDVYRKKLDTGGWECSVHSRDMKSGSSTDVCQKPRTDGLEESAIITVSPKSLTFIHTIRKPGPGDQSSIDSVGEVYMLRGPEMAVIDSRMAELRARLKAMPEIRPDMPALHPSLKLQYQFDDSAEPPAPTAAPVPPTPATAPAAPAPSPQP